jgi:signal transduction histidine kinase/ligand-binding sensor domain-containing protein
MRILAVMGLLAAAATAQRYQFRYFGMEDGLGTAITGLLQDRTGFLWVGTSNGLFRYDGSHFQRYGLEDGLPSVSIRAVHQSPDGALWVATGRGLARLRRDRFELVPTGTGGNPDLRAVDSAPDGTLYVGYGGGLLIGSASEGGGPRFHPVAGASAEPVSVVHVDPHGKLWFGCGLKICEMDQGRLRVFGKSDGLSEDRWGAILEDAGGTLWVRAPEHLSVLPAGAQRFVSRDLGLPQSSNTIMSVITDSMGTVLVATDQGIARWIDRRWQIIGSAQGLESEAVTVMLRDREGSLWIGLWGTGIARWGGYAEWANFTRADGLSSDIVWAIGRDLSGSLWVGTDRGLAEMRDGRSLHVLNKAAGLGGDKIKSVLVAPDGAIWVAALPGGVSCIDPSTRRIRNYGAADGLADDRVISLHLDSQQRLWASTSEGLFRSTSLEPGLRFERQQIPGYSARASFYRFMSDRQGRLWVTGNEGLFRWDAGQWTRFGTNDGLKADATSHIAQSNDGSIWVSYREPMGMSRLTPQGAGFQVEHFTKKAGLPSDYILFFGVDSASRLWVGTDNGVAVLSSSTWTTYTHEDGLVWDDCAANAFLAEADGTVWIGTLRGLSRFRPSGLSAPPAVPPVVITSTRFGARQADLSAAAQVSYRDRDFRVTFSALSFLSERNMHFRYRLEGMDEQWIDTTLREARYSNLPPGQYRFTVMARRANGPWSSPAASPAFRIVPPWWRSWWFRAVGLGGILAFCLLGVRARMNKMDRERRRLERAVSERTAELQQQKNVVETQKIEIEGLLRQSQEVSRLKSEFLANMSHEIRTPMNGVIGMTELVLGTPLTPEQREYIATVRDSAEALLVVINDILDFSKIEAGKMELVHEPFPIGKCAGDAMQVFGWKAEAKGLRLQLQIDAAVPAIVEGDPGRIRQVLLNLLGNAMKFTESGRITLAISVDSSVGDSQPAGQLRFSVADTGIGIPKEKQTVIFEAFAQADGSARRRCGGTGLGLAISARLVELMGRRIWVESQPGAGSTFSFTIPLGLPLSVANPVVPLSASPPAASDGSLSILLAEDNAVNQRLAQRMIERMGYSVTVVDNGRKAVEAALRQTFDLILMDVQMPEMDGFEATACIRRAEDAHRRNTPIVAVTAHAMAGDREQCLRAGMDNYISKPIHFEDLQELVNHTVRRP